MNFHLSITVNTNDTSIKDDCVSVLANFLDRQGYCFDVGYNPNELDVTKIGHA